METIKLEQYCKVVETGSLVKASKLCGISISGLSKSLKNLQEEIGADLLIPQGRGIQVTENGRIVYKIAIEIIQNINRIKDQGQSRDPLCKIGLVEIFSTEFAHELTADYSCPVEIFECQLNEIESKISDGLLDFAITYKPNFENGIDYIEIGQFLIGVYCRKECKKKIMQNKFEIEFVLPILGPPLDSHEFETRKNWHKLLTQSKALTRVNRLHLGINLALNRDLLIFLPTFLADKINSQKKEFKKFYKINLLNKDLNIKRKVYLIKKSNQSFTKEMRILQEKIVQLIK